MTYYDHLVARYANMSILDVQDLNIVDYLVIRRDAFISMLQKTEKGAEYLTNAYRLEQTEPDRKSLREKFGKEG